MSTYRGPGERIIGTPWSGRAEAVDDPFTSIGPGIVYGLGRKAVAYGIEKMLVSKGVGLSDDVARTFRFGQYTATTLDEPMIMARYYDNVNAYAKGRYMTNPSSLSGNTFIDRTGLALRFGWNKMTKVAYWEVPAGTTIYSGKAAAQFPWVGGKTQYFVPVLDNLKRVVP